MTMETLLEENAELGLLLFTSILLNYEPSGHYCFRLLAICISVLHS